MNNGTSCRMLKPNKTHEIARPPNATKNIEYHHTAVSRCKNGQVANNSPLGRGMRGILACSLTSVWVLSLNNQTAVRRCVLFWIREYYMLWRTLLSLLFMRTPPNPAPLSATSSPERTRRVRRQLRRATPVQQRKPC